LAADYRDLQRLRISNPVHVHGRIGERRQAHPQNQGSQPEHKIAFVGPHGHIKPEETLNASEDIDFVTRGEFDHSVVDYAHGKPLSEIQGVSYRKDGKVVHNAERPQLHT